MKKLLLTAAMIMSASVANSGVLTEQLKREQGLDTMSAVYLVSESCELPDAQLKILQSLEHLYRISSTPGKDPMYLKGTDIEIEWNKSIIRSVGNPSVRAVSRYRLMEGTNLSQEFKSACTSATEAAEYFYNVVKDL